MNFTSSDLSELLCSHPNIPGASIGISQHYQVTSIAAGYARAKTGEVMTCDHYLECASLSKTVAAAFALEYFQRKQIPMTTAVNQLLDDCNCPFKIWNSDCTSFDTEAVTLAMLVNHTALGMHYVFGIPLSSPMPAPLELLTGVFSAQYGYKALFLERNPGDSFAYSGGGFIVLQLLLEYMENLSIEEIVRPFLDACGLDDFTFHLENSTGRQYAYGHFTRTKEVQPDDGGRLKFPPLAAGGLCTSKALMQFLNHLAIAFRCPAGSGGISQATAVAMLGEQSLVDKGAIEFMRAKVGLGVFVATAGENKIMLHQAANDGFRGVYMMCFDGPDSGNGFLIMCNGDNPAVHFQCELARLLLSADKGLGLSGVDFSRVSNTFDMTGLKQETIVNLGLRELVLAAFIDPYADRKLLSKL